MRKTHQGAYEALESIPTQPEGLSVDVGFRLNNTALLLPATLPRRARLVLRALSSWGPAHSSEDEFRLSTNAQRSHWILWHGYFDDNDCMKWIYQPVAICRHARVPPRAAAFYMLVKVLRSRLCFADILNCITGGILTENEVHLALAIAKAQTN